MANFVIKKDGTKEPFDSEKIMHGVNMAAEQAGLDEEEAKDVAKRAVEAVTEEISDINEIEVSEIRNKIVSFLESEIPSVAEAWKSYEAAK